MGYDLAPQDRGRKMASKKAAGLAQMATTAQMNTATRDDRVVNPLSLEARLVAREGIMQYADVTITSAQVLLLATTPIELVAAPGASKILKFMGAVLKLDYGGTNAFTETADNLTIKYVNAAGAAASQAIECTGFIDATADTYTTAEPVIDAIVAATAIENKALVLDNINDNFGGNAGDDNSLIVRCFYQIVTI
ncbi:hypothetical protein OAF54_02070 [bacterium]|nr:hypothetical protein [bacterium]